MKRNSTILALCLLGTCSAFAQTTTTYSSDSSRTTSTTATPSYSTDSASTNSTSATGSTTYSTTPSSDASSSTTTTTYGTTRERRVKDDKPYKAFTGGFYVGANSTRYRGENIDRNNLNGRLGYQIGVFARGGGRLYGQLGVEYFASSSEFFRPEDLNNPTAISGRINTKWLQIPVMVGYKLVQSDRGISAVRIAIGGEYANNLSSSNTVQIDNSEIKSGTFLGLANIGFDAGPVFLDFFYHHGFSDVVSGFNNSTRRSLGVNFGFKF